MHAHTHTDHSLMPTTANDASTSISSIYNSGDQNLTTITTQHICMCTHHHLGLMNDADTQLLHELLDQMYQGIHINKHVCCISTHTQAHKHKHRCTSKRTQCHTHAHSLDTSKNGRAYICMRERHHLHKYTYTHIDTHTQRRHKHSTAFECR